MSNKNIKELLKSEKMGSTITFVPTIELQEKINKICEENKISKQKLMTLAIKNLLSENWINKDTSIR